MRNVFLSLVLLAASIASAQEAPRPTFPDDYTPSPCAPDKACESYPKM
jgi:hypothetical protein